MAEPRSILYPTAVTVCGFVCSALACVTLFLPNWGLYENRYGLQYERGHFGLWKVCKKLNYGREICGDRFRFQLSDDVYIIRILAMFSCANFAIFTILSVKQIAMIKSKNTVVLKYKICVILKLAFAIIDALLALAVIILFVVTIHESIEQFIITGGISFNLQIVLVLLAIGLVVFALCDVIFTYRESGDSMQKVIVMNGLSSAPTFDGFGLPMKY